jgi:hypothetical protein
MAEPRRASGAGQRVRRQEVSIKVKVPATKEAYDLTTLEEVKAIIGIPNYDEAGNQDYLINMLIHRTSSALCGRCSRLFQPQSYTDYFSSDGYREKLRVKNPPIRSTEGFSVYVDYEHSFGDDTLLVLHTDFEVDMDVGRIFFYTPVTQGLLHIKVVYPGGFDPIPDGLKAACEEWCASLFRLSNDQAHRLDSVNSPGWNLAIRPSTIPDHVLPFLEPYIIDGTT